MCVIPNLTKVYGIMLGIVTIRWDFSDLNIRMCLSTLRKYDMNCDILMTILCIS